MFLTVEQERSAAHTASYTGALVILGALAANLGAPGFGEALPELPGHAEEVLASAEVVRAYAHEQAQALRFVYAGAGPNSWTALEGALKAKEAAYVTAEGTALETLLHGPLIGLERGDQLVLVNVPGPFESRASEVAVASEKIGMGVFFVGTPPLSSSTARGVRLPETPELLSPVLAALPVQLLACFLAEARGANPDSFRRDVERYAEAMKPIHL